MTAPNGIPVITLKIKLRKLKNKVNSKYTLTIIKALIPLKIQNQTRRIILDYIKAFSADGNSFMLFKDGTWKLEMPQSNSSEAFRSIPWGTSIDDVKKFETAAIVHEEKGMLCYKTKIANHDALAVYIFTENKLARGKYIFEQEHASDQSYLHDFWEIKDLLTEKYGVSLESHQFWENDLYRDDVSEWGMAISCGHASFFEEWNVKDSHIELQLYGDNYEVTLAILYESISLKGLLENEKKNSILQDL